MSSYSEGLNALWCCEVQCVTLHFSAAVRTVVHNSTIRCSGVRAVLCGAVQQCSKVQWSMTHCAKQYRVVRKLVSYVIGGDVQLCRIGSNTVVSGIQIGWYTSVL